jgi:hypothetical protein
MKEQLKNNFINGFDVGTETTMDTEDFVADYCGKC